MRNFSMCVLTILVMVFAGCDINTGSKPKATSGAAQANVDKVRKNSRGLTVEQQNIQDRINVTTDPTKVMWIHVIALDGSIIKRMPVRCKITSSSKRLEPTTGVFRTNTTYDSSLPSYNGYSTTELLQPDGTYGSSDPYVYWFDPMGRYHQLGTAGGLGYLLTDYPIDLEDPIDAITGLYKVHEAAAKWQAEQEAKMRSGQ